MNCFTLSAQIGVPADREHRVVALAPLREGRRGPAPAEPARIVQLLVGRVNVQEDVLEVRIRAEGLASLVGELRQRDERRAA